MSQILRFEIVEDDHLSLLSSISHTKNTYLLSHLIFDRFLANGVSFKLQKAVISFKCLKKTKQHKNRAI